MVLEWVLWTELDLRLAPLTSSAFKEKPSSCWRRVHRAWRFLASAIMAVSAILACFMVSSSSKGFFTVCANTNEDI